MAETRWIRRLGTQSAGFRYVGPTGRPVRDPRVLARVDALRIPPAYRDVHIAVAARASIQAWGFDARGRKQYRYHARAVEQGALRKYHRVSHLARDLPRIRGRIAADLRAPGLTRERVTAGALRLIAVAGMRVGSDRYERENGTFGTTTLRKSHVTALGRDRVALRYRGKRSIVQQREFVDRVLARFLAECGKTPGRRLLRYQQDGTWVDLTARDVNQYLHELVGVPYTAKDFRTWTGTLACASALADAGDVTSERQAKRTVVGAVRAVATTLGNTPAISRKSYIHPIVIAQYLDHRATIAPYRRASARTRGRTRDEAALTAFLAEHFPDRRQQPRT
jgi:DNA topoisomerase-1